jgi:hypothetical protein
MDNTRIGALAMEFISALETDLPENAQVVAVGIVGEVRYICENCGGTHTITPVLTTTDSVLHDENLFYCASECATEGGGWLAHVSEGSEADDD